MHEDDPPFGEHPRDPQFNLFDQAPDPAWPPYERFPYNHGREKVERIVRSDLIESRGPLVITGYTSLDRIIDFLAEYRITSAGGPREFSRLRVLFGHEPSASRRESYPLRRHGLSSEAASYWMERGISIHLCAKVLAALELLESDAVEVRVSGDVPVHAKIYKGDDAITIGSSNFSYSGMRWQVEGNSRFTRKQDKKRFREAVELAEAIWEFGTDFKTALRALLERLLRAVSWEEALARACAELLEGDWARRYLAAHGFGEAQPLWPAQEQGIAQAMWVLENIGSVLVADATGSGKTRMGAHLMRGLQVRNWRTGRIRHDIPVLVCPPHVAPHWHRETNQCGQAVNVYSQGILAARRARLREDTVQAIRRAQVLAVDEAHNFLNRGSIRTRTLYANMADHVLLFTATPINRGPQDLLPIIDLLGGDNFDDAVLKAVEQVWRRRRRNKRERLSTGERETIARAIQRFTVRRTKRALNEAVNREPERYRNELGSPCRYPDHVPMTYDCRGSDRDRSLALQIRKLAGELRGVTHFQSKLEVPEYLRMEGLDDERYLANRLRAAAALAGYHIAKTLRSSRAAVLEHVYGTPAARELCGIRDRVKSESTGDVIGVLRSLRGRVPESALEADLPDWLADPAAHANACDEEIRLYEAIGELAREMSSAREAVKAELLVDLLDRHPLVLAFDSHLITLSDMRERLVRMGRSRIMLATGQSRAMRERVNQAFELKSDERDVIALCSDALSEGVNLQAASVVVLLDMPSVIRVAEQRIGRVDRMDSPHREIEVYWPVDAEEFALRTDEVFLDRHRDVEDLIGSNVPLPELIRRGGDGDAPRAVAIEAYAAEVERVGSGEESWDGIRDAFDPVRALVSGDGALVPTSIYASLKAASAPVLSSVSVLGAPEDWAFYAIGGNERGAPRWVYFDGQTRDPVTDLEEVSRRLRARLSETVQQRPLDELAGRRIERDIDRLEERAAELLPRKKRKALKEMKNVLDGYLADAARTEDAERETAIQEILRLLEPGFARASIDLGI